MGTELVHVGWGNMVAMNRVVAVASPTSTSIKRLVQEGKSNNLSIDLTKGRQVRSVLITDSGHIILAAISAETIARRLITAQTTPHPLAEGEE
ncbi:MAG: DUF370 domain-containing protein [Chloroflexota bacterium]